MLHSALFEGRIRHRRFSPVSHDFDYGIAMLWLDLSEYDEVFSGHKLWSVNQSNVAAFHRCDHFGENHQDLAQTIRAVVEQACGRRFSGPIRLLTHPRYFGHVFNPVSFYFCYDGSGEQIEAIVAEVSNTPWRDMHLYVLNPDDNPLGELRFRAAKAFYVSPFMPMEQDYCFRFNQPGQRLNVHIENWQDGVKVFDATLSLTRKPITHANLSRVLWRFPLMTIQVVVGIYFQALRLWRKKLTFFPRKVKDNL